MIFKADVFFKALLELTRVLPLTLAVGVGAFVLGLLIGSVIGVLRTFKVPVLDDFLKFYTSFFRGTPLMIQLFIFFFGLPQLFPHLGTMSAFTASIIVMSINAGAYISETMRASLTAVDDLQQKAGLAVGLTRLQTLFYIELPQAVKVAIPPLGNTFIGVIQGTSLTFMLGLNDLMGMAKMRAASNYRFLEVYLATGILYWVITLIIGKLNNRIEMRFSKGLEHD